MVFSANRLANTLRTLGVVVALVPLAAQADTGFYLGGSASGATIEADLNGISLPGLPASIDEDDTALEIFAGYRFDLPVVGLGIEAGYVDFGEPDIDVLGDELTFDTTGINVWGIAALDLGLFDVYGKLGYIAWEVDAKYLDSSASEDGYDLAYGLGAEFDIGPVLLRGELELYDLDDADVTMLSLGVAYQFN